jgi:RNA polymerase sigma-70 factor (ECF subfamily)
MITNTASLPNAIAIPDVSKWRSCSATGKTSDTDLIKAISAGDQLAMRVLFARHNVRVCRYVLRFVSDESLAEEVVSDVFIEVWRNAARFEGRSQVSTWLLGIARFKALSAVRRRKDEALDDAVANAIPDSTDDPEIATQKKDRLAILRECMSHLSRDHREVIDLVYCRERLVDEAAEILGVPENTVKSRMFEARRRMSVLLQQAGIDQTYL